MSRVVAPGSLDRRFTGRSLVNGMLDTACVIATILALAPLFAVLILLVVKGLSGLSVAAFTDLPPTPSQESGGGFGNALVGTFLMMGIAALVSLPLGILGAVHLVEFGAGSKFAATVRFAAKVLSGLPSIIAGVLFFSIAVVTWGSPNAVAGGLALSVLMLPTVVIASEEALRQVPSRLRQAALGMGCTRFQMAWKVVLPTAAPELVTGAMLALARAAGETAPLLLTAQFAANSWPIDGESPFVHLGRPTASLAVLIFDFSSSPFQHQVDLAWAAALVLVVIVLVLNLAGKGVAARGNRHRRS